MLGRFQCFSPFFSIEFLYTSVAKKGPFAKMLSQVDYDQLWMLHCAWKEKP